MVITESYYLNRIVIQRRCLRFSIDTISVL